MKKTTKRLAFRTTTITVLTPERLAGVAGGYLGPTVSCKCSNSCNAACYQPTQNGTCFTSCDVCGE